MEAGKPTAVKGRGTEFYYPAITTNFGRPKALPQGDRQDTRYAAVKEAKRIIAEAQERQP